MGWVATSEWKVPSGPVHTWIQNGGMVGGRGSGVFVPGGRPPRNKRKSKVPFSWNEHPVMMQATDEFHWRVSFAM